MFSPAGEGLGGRRRTARLPRRYLTPLTRSACGEKSAWVAL
jgi:hypothetical protein